jgi:hypothetical protein
LRSHNYKNGENEIPGKKKKKKRAAAEIQHPTSSTTKLVGVVAET